MVFKRKGAPKRKLIRRRRWARRPQRTLVNRALHPIPQRFITKMKYSDIFSTSGTVGRLNLNSIYDPDRTGIGHQPYGFDTLATLYNRYRVISCGWRIHTVAPLSSTSSNPSIQIAAQPANEELSPSTLSEMRENPRAKYIVQNPGAPAVYLSGKCYIPSLVGRTKAQYMADDRYQAMTNANPQELAVLNIVASTGADLLIGWSLNVTLEYTVEFFDIKHLAQS